MKKFVCATALAAAMLASSSIASAADSGPRGGWLVNLDLDYGGDDLATASFTDGESQHVKAGQGVAFGVGGYSRPIESSSDGLTHYMGPELNGDGFFEDIEVDDATGFTAEVGCRRIGLHYTKMDYASEGYEDADASYVGLRLSYKFGAPNQSLAGGS